MSDHGTDRTDRTGSEGVEREPEWCGEGVEGSGVASPFAYPFLEGHGEPLPEPFAEPFPVTLL